MRRWGFQEWVAFLAASAIVFFMMIGVCGCEVLKGKTRTNKDSLEVAKVDSGAISRDHGGSSKEGEYERTTYIYPKDTNVTNNYIYPTTVIKERGTTKEVSTYFNFDSAWRRKEDSVLRSQSVTIKNKETEFFGWDKIMAIFLGLGILLIIYKKVK